MEPLPAYLHREEPDEDCAACINGSPGTAAQALCHTQAKEVEEGNADNAAYCGRLSNRQLQHMVTLVLMCWAGLVCQFKQEPGRAGRMLFHLDK